MQRRRRRSMLLLGLVAALLAAAGSTPDDALPLPIGERAGAIDVGTTRWYAVELDVDEVARVQVGLTPRPDAPDALVDAVVRLRWSRPEAPSTPCSGNERPVSADPAVRAALDSPRPTRGGPDPCRRPGRHLLAVTVDGPAVGEAVDLVTLASVIAPVVSTTSPTAAPRDDAPSPTPVVADGPTRRVSASGTGDLVAAAGASLLVLAVVAAAVVVRRLRRGPT